MIRLQCTLAGRDIILRAVSAACRLVVPQNDAFAITLLSAVSEAFNNIFFHSYKESIDGIILTEIIPGQDNICVTLQDYGDSFDPSLVPLPNLDTLPERGMGLFIIQSFVEFSYVPGPPNRVILKRRAT